MSIEGREPAESRATAEILRATRRLGPNDHRAWAVRETDRGTYARTTQDSVDAQRWSDEVESRSFATWQQAVVDEPALTDLSASTPIRFEIEGLANQVALAGLLRCKSTEDEDDVGWPYGEVGTVGDQKVYFLKRPDTDEYVPFLGDEDEILGNAIAEYSWSDDYFPVSTTYTSTLIEFSPGLAVLRPTGDLLEEGATVIVLTDDPETRANGVTEWLGHMAGAYEASVFALEPLDPDGQLSSSERDAWESALEHDHYSLDFSLDTKTEAALRRSLNEEYPTYEFIRQALADPLGEKGQKVYVDITEDDMLFARY